MIAASFDKGAVARSFSLAASAYDGWAPAQAAIARSLASRLPDRFRPALAVDVGCGTGLLSEALLSRYPGVELVGVDLAPGMVDACRRRFAGRSGVRFVTADAEAAPLPVEGADLAAGSCVAQWFDDPFRTVAAWGASLATGGVLAFAVLLEGSFPELFGAYREATGRELRGVRLVDRSFAGSVASAAGLRLVACDEEEAMADYGSPLGALRSFRGIGASLAGHGGSAPLRPDEVRRLLDRYGSGGGRGTVTHLVQYMVAVRP